MTRELDERQEALHRIDTLNTRPLTIAPAPARPKRTLWARLVRALKQIIGRSRRP